MPLCTKSTCLFRLSFYFALKSHDWHLYSIQYLRFCFSCAFLSLSGFVLVIYKMSKGIVSPPHMQWFHVYFQVSFRCKGPFAYVAWIFFPCMSCSKMVLYLFSAICLKVTRITYIYFVSSWTTSLCPLNETFLFVC